MNQRVVLNHAEHFKEPLGFCREGNGNLKLGFLEVWRSRATGEEEELFPFFPPLSHSRLLFAPLVSLLEPGRNLDPLLLPIWEQSQSFQRTLGPKGFQRPLPSIRGLPSLS